MNGVEEAYLCEGTHCNDQENSAHCNDIEKGLYCNLSGITGPATLKYRLEDEMISDYVAQKQAAGDTRPMQEIAVEYNDTVIYPDKVRLNCYYLHHYSFWMDIKMIFATVLGKRIRYGGEVV